MRPELLSLLAVCAVALVGCSAAEPTDAPAETPSASAVDQTPIAERSISNAPVGSVNSSDLDSLGITPEEYGFTVYAFGQSAGSEDGVPTIAETVEALHAYCDSGEPFDISDERGLNGNLEKVAKEQACPEIADSNR